MAEESQTIVIDNGSQMIKAGYGGEEVPRIVCPSNVGRPKYYRVVLGHEDKNVYIGDNAYENAEVLFLNYPIKHGVITNWDDMEILWRNIFERQLAIDTSQHPVIITEPAKNPKSNREKMAQILFESFNVPSLYVSVQGILSLYTFGRNTGIVCNIGDGVSEFYPIYEGIPIPQAAIRNDFAGDDVTNWLQELLREHGHNFTTTAEKVIVRDIKEKHSYTPLDYESELQKAKNTADCEVQYTLPDGNIITISDERFRCSELLFQPNMNGFELDGIHQNILNSIKRCKTNFHKDLYSNILLCGGASMTEGLPYRLEKEIVNSVPQAVNVRIAAPPERKYSTWIGGSIFSQCITSEKYISRSEYDEIGKAIVHQCT